MKTEVKKIDSTKREIDIEISGDVVKNKFEEVFKKIGQEAEIAGFRPGKAPRDILEKHYSGIAHEEVLKSLVPEIYNRAIESENLDVVDLPKISEVKLNKDTLSFTATVEIKPQIQLKDYKGIKINYKDIEVTENEIKARLDSIKESRKIENIDDSVAKSLGYPTFLDLEKATKAQIYLQKENEQRIKIEQDIIKHLIKEVDFTLPLSLVERQLKDLVSRGKIELALRGVPEEDIQKQEDRLQEQLKPEAEQHLRIYLILEAIAKKENIALNEQMPSKTMEFLLREANWITTEAQS